jgi:uncharacterized protein
MSDSKITTVQAMYEAFGHGDVDAILEHLTDDVDWASEAATGSAPWHGVKRGKAEVPSFFEALARTTEVTEFTPLSFAANETDVLAVIRYGFTSRETGKSGTMNIHHWWRFRDGKVYSYRGSEDTELTAEVLGTVATPA